MGEMWERYGQNMGGVWQRYGQNTGSWSMGKLLLEYGLDMQEIIGRI